MEVITTHTNADFDALASMLAAKKLYPNARLVFPGSQERNLRDFFIHSTLYALEVERIKNIDLGRVSRLILVDTRQAGRIGKFAEIAGRPGVDIHIYDHHPPSAEDLHGSLEIIGHTGANVTLLGRILEERNLSVTSDEATVMMLGLYEDTGNLTFSSVTEEDFRVAAFLLRKGANLNILSDVITRELTAEQVFLLNDLIHSATRFAIHGIDAVVAQASTERYIGDIAVLVHKLKDMENLDVLFVLVRMEDRVYLIGRSRLKEVNVAEVINEFGGGGHPTAASATIKGMSLSEVQDRLMVTLREVIRPKRMARDVMVFPAKTVDAGQSLEEAGDVLLRYNLAVLPVMEGNNVAGLLSKQTIERAARHGLGTSAVRNFMTTEFSVIPPDAPFSKVQQIIIGQNQSLLPVVDQGRLAGTVSTADVVRVFQEEMSKSAQAASPLEGHPLYGRKKLIGKFMSERLSERIQSLLREMGSVGDALGYPVYAVGGFVRDLLMRVDNFDVDVVVEGDGIRFAEAFEKRVPCQIRTHRRFGTAIIFFSDGLKVDVATARIEVYESPAALPTVESSSIKMDLYRRDFTINTLAIQLNPKGFGEVIDFFGGMKDLKERLIRVLHNLSFVEDPTRVFRAIRFEQRLGFQIGKHTQQLMKSAVELGLMERLSGGRIQTELVLILKEGNPLAALRRMNDFDLFRYLHPGLHFNADMENLFGRLHEIISWYALLFLDAPCEPWLIYLYGLVDELKEEDLEAFCRRLGMNERDRRRTLRGKKQAEESLFRLYSWISTGHEPKRSEMHALLHPFATEVKLFMMAKTTQTATRRYISLYFTQLKDTKPLLKGADLIRMGVEPGPDVKRVLSHLLKAKLDEQVTTPEEEKEFVTLMAGGKR
jgi:tRNA nucleotidyltransferase (CCA-adding enzyme)